MAGARKKTSLSERKEIVEYCLSHGKNNKDTAAHYKGGETRQAAPCHNL